MEGVVERSCGLVSSGLFRFRSHLGALDWRFKRGLGIAVSSGPSTQNTEEIHFSNA